MNNYKISSIFGRPFALTRGLAVGAACILVLSSAPAGAITITFDEGTILHGQIIDNEFTASHGVTISAENLATGAGVDDFAVAFDTTDTAQTADPDLRGPPAPGNWDSGNLSPNVVLNNILIIQENPVLRCVFANPAPECNPADDEGSRPAGSLFIDFDFGITSFGFDLIDVEGPLEFGATSGFFAAFFTSGGALIGKVGFGDFLDNTSTYFDPTVAFGNNSANRISPISIAGLGGGFNTASFVEISLGGSGGIDNIVYTVPEPGTLAIFVFGLAGIVALRRRRGTDRGD